MTDLADNAENRRIRFRSGDSLLTCPERTEKTRIIDFHTHTFPGDVSSRILKQLSGESHVQYFTEGSPEALSESMKANGTAFSVNLPVMTRPDQVVRVNDSLIRRQEAWNGMGIITFGGMHPLYEDLHTELKRLRSHGIRGIKIHPAFQRMALNHVCYKRLLSAASEEDMICVAHCGEDVGSIGHNYADIAMILDILEDVRPKKLVLAHMGGWQAWKEVQSDLAGAPVYLDTAFSLGPVCAAQEAKGQLPYTYNLTTEAFAALARSHGTQRVLFATDSPWAKLQDYLEFIRQTDLTEAEKEQILSENAAALLGIQEREK